MKAYFTVAMLALFLMLNSQGLAQGSKSRGQFWENVKRSTYNAPWTVGLGWNVIDDDGAPFNNLFDASNSWNVVPYPSKLSLEKGLLQGWSVEAAANYNQMKSGKIVNNDLMKSTQTFLSFDINGKFSFLDFMKNKIFFDPYLLHGYGYTYRGAGKNPNAATANIWFGL